MVWFGLSPFVKEVFERITEKSIKRVANEKQRHIEIEKREKQRGFELEKLKLQNEYKVMVWFGLSPFVKKVIERIMEKSIKRMANEKQRHIESEKREKAKRF
ncbi:hypothetical protein CEXT_766291 [Caerostris extrusa]|uniref:Uncharacterized protein n=1 Tax=Caerostris extrusa TaxID=172846 RepID=A0AAV4UD58_CAEEX|nr:hypothetical protein CEXT_766291 [Caerostris extrusa]